jgi:hypothetical protein
MKTTLALPNSATGQIALLPSNTVLRPGTNRTTLEQSPEAQDWIQTICAPNHESYTLSGTWEIHGTNVGLTVWFERGWLTSITIFSRSGATGWDTWSEGDALRQRDELEQLLAAAYGSRRQFPWGTLDATYDPRSGSSGIAVRYTV